MIRRLPLILALAAMLALPVTAQASDASLKRALLPYKNTLTIAILYLAGLDAAPAKSQGKTVESRAATFQSDFAKVEQVARSQKASTSAGRKAIGELMLALGDTYTAAGDLKAAGAAAAAGKASTAQAYVNKSQSRVKSSLVPYQAAGKAFGLFG